MKRILMATAVAAFAYAAPTIASADSNAYNAHDTTVAVLWLANGCAKTRSACGYWLGYERVCKKKHLEPGQSGSYHFPDGTSVRKFLVVDCHTGWEWSTRTGNKGKKKRCAAITATTDGEEHAAANCGYTPSEYEALKNGTSASLRKGPTISRLPGYPKR